MDKGQNWHVTWMNIALEISKKSKDPDTKVGAILVSPNNKNYFTGYNGFATGVKETDERWQRPTKYKLVLHAEENAVHNRMCPVEDWTMYSTLSPCNHCASVIIQSGIKKVIYLKERTGEGFEWTPTILKECGVLYWDIDFLLGGDNDKSCGARWKNS